jgi:hypothetical protein
LFSRQQVFLPSSKSFRARGFRTGRRTFGQHVPFGLLRKNRRQKVPLDVRENCFNFKASVGDGKRLLLDLFQRRP